MAVQSLRDIEGKSPSRFSTTFDELDWLYGRTDGFWGMPEGKISLWAGIPGVGKTRLLVEIMKRLDQRRFSSMLFQGELTPAEFRGEKMPDYQVQSEIWVSQDVSIEEQIQAIQQYKPRLVITDSVQQIEEYGNGKGSKEIVRRLRKVLDATRTHCVLISQVTLGGTPRGGTTLSHEVDLDACLKPDNLLHGIFYLSARKNRYGELREVMFQHMDWGVRCCSQGRLRDKKWLQDYRKMVMWLKANPKALARTSLEAMYKDVPSVGDIPESGKIEKLRRWFGV